MAAKRIAGATPGTTRRTLLGVGITGLAGALLPYGRVWASDAPEVAAIRIGVAGLVDASPIVIAHQKGVFRRNGLNTMISTAPTWTAVQGVLESGECQVGQMPFGAPLASRIGLLGSPRKGLIVPWILNRNGQAITLRTGLKGQVAADPRPLRELAQTAQSAGARLTFAMTFASGTHAMWLRYWLAAGGVNPDRDVSLVAMPPAEMLAGLKDGTTDGCCVGEPWSVRAITEGAGFTALATHDIWKDHPETVCAFTEEFADKNPRTVKAVLRALHEASLWLDDLGNRAELAAILSQPAYLDCPRDLLLGRLLGQYDFGDGRKKKDVSYMIFSARNCNYPQPKYAYWWLSQFRRWGMVESAPDYSRVARHVMRPEIYEEAMRELGYRHGGLDNRPEKLFDGVGFDPARAEAYAKSFAVHGLKG